jgi:hypothetical protein
VQAQQVTPQVYTKEEVLPIFSPETQLEMRATDDPKEGATLAIQDLEQQGELPAGTVRAINLYDQGDPTGGVVLMFIFENRGDVL